MAAFKKSSRVQSFHTKINDISSGPFAGKELVTISISKEGFETYHTLYFLWDGTQIWTGHMTGGLPEDYEMVRRILSVIKTGSEQAVPGYDAQGASYPEP